MEVVRSACPGCQRPLTVPADWVGKTVRCKHCGHSMQVRKKAAPPPLPNPPPVRTPPPLPRAKAAAPVGTPAPTWEPLPEDGPLPEFSPPAAPAADLPGGAIVAPVGTAQKYAGRGRYKGPRNRGWVKYAVLGVLLAALVGGVGAGVYFKPDLFKSLTGGGGTVENGGITEGTPGGPYVPPPVTPAASGTFPRRMLAISIHSYLYLNPLRNGEDTFAANPNQRTGTDAAVSRLAQGWRVPRDQLYHLTDVAVVDEKARDAKAADPKSEPKRIEVKPIPKKGAGKEPAKKEMAKKGPAKKGPPEAMPDKADEMPVIQPKRLVGTPPLKSVVEGTIARFLDTSRPQDRIVLLFCGHVVEKKGEVYLVPLEGDLDEVGTLIPLKWVYEKLAACPAQEKVVIYDVCRLDSEGSIERPHPGPMTEAIEKALHDSPDGVTVVTSCSKGEHALEARYEEAPLNFGRADIKEGKVALRGSFFLSLLEAASAKGFLVPENKLSSPTDELPVERMTSWVGEKLGEVVQRKFSDRTQTLKATVKRKAEAVGYNPDEPMPGRFEFPAPPPSADPKAVVAIVREVQLPPVKSIRADAPPPQIADVLPFSEADLKDYLRGELKPADKPNEFQKAVLDAVQEMRALQDARRGTQLPEEFGGDTSDSAKAELRKVQEVPALVESILQEQLENLEKVADQKAKQPKRWQAHYDYVLAQVKLRICYANQYNLALANVRSGKLPDLKDGQTGYRLAAEMTLDKNTPANYKEMFAEARKALADMAKEYPNTPWALLAKSDKAVAIGLRLTGSSSGKGAGG